MTSPKMLAALALIATVGCGGDDSSDDEGGTDTGPRYVVANEIYTADSSTTYLNVLSSLDHITIDATVATEFDGGRATISAYNGWLFVAPPDRPVITRYAINAKGALVKEGEISFANYGLESVYIDDWALTFISPTKAYLFNSDDGVNIVFDPTTMTLVGEIQPTQSLVRSNLSLNTSGTYVRGNRLFQMVYWTDWDAYVTSSEQYLTVIDTDTDKMIALVPEQRCPGLSNRVDVDEAGNAYFSNYIWNVSETLVRGAPSSCALRLPPNAETFDDWKFDYRTITDGREGAIYAYLGNGKATLNVFYNELATYDANSDAEQLASAPYWKLWQVDVVAGTGAPLEGADWMTGGTTTFHVDDRTFVSTPAVAGDTTDYAEIVDGKQTPSFSVTGWSYQFVKVR